MQTGDELRKRVSLANDRLAAVVAAVGAASLAYGSYMHFTMGDRTLGNCVASGACDPWDPTWVLTPLVIGGLLLLVPLVLRR